MPQDPDRIHPPTRYFYIQAPNILALPEERAFNQPQTVFWSVFLPNWVIEARPYLSHRSHLERLRIARPLEFRHHVHVTLSHFWIPCFGPARRLTDHEYIQIVHEHRPEIPLPEFVIAPEDFSP